jgi:hypothetical protein
MNPLTSTLPREKPSRLTLGRTLTPALLMSQPPQHRSKEPLHSLADPEVSAGAIAGNGLHCHSPGTMPGPSQHHPEY